MKNLVNFHQFFSYNIERDIRMVGQYIRFFKMMNLTQFKSFQKRLEI